MTDSYFASLDMYVLFENTHLLVGPPAPHETRRHRSTLIGGYFSLEEARFVRSRQTTTPEYGDMIWAINKYRVDAHPFVAQQIRRIMELKPTNDTGGRASPLRLFSEIEINNLSKTARIKENLGPSDVPWIHQGFSSYLRRDGDEHFLAGLKLAGVNVLNDL